jgi:hypothetical protein
VIKYKKLICICCAALILAMQFQHFAFVSFIHFKKSDFKKTSSFSASTNCITLKISTENLYKNHAGISWEDDNKEIVLNGKFYDIKRIFLKGNYTILFVISDASETVAFLNYFANDKPLKNSLINLLKFLGDFQFTLSYSYLFYPINYNANSFSERFNFYKFKYFSCSIKPPQFL